MGLTLTSHDAAAFPAHQELHAERDALVRTLDALGQAFVLCDASGREVRRSRRLGEIVSADPEGARLIGEMWSLATSLLGAPGFTAGPQPVRTMGIATATARYQIRATYLDPESPGPDDTVLVALERLTPQLPSAELLMTRLGLTAKEADVASLLALGLSNREIAGRLSMSVHTVRHHAEWIFAKLGIHSRKALGLTLMSEGA